MDANLAQRNVDLATRDEQLNIREQELKATTDKLQRQYAELEEVLNRAGFGGGHFV